MGIVETVPGDRGTLWPNAIGAEEFPPRRLNREAGDQRGNAVDNGVQFGGALPWNEVDQDYRGDSLLALHDAVHRNPYNRQMPTGYSL
jgi:hypothetical protein